MIEVWKPVFRMERWYEVSSIGRVKRIETGRILAISKGKGGHPQLVLSVEANRINTYVHVLVAEAFIGPRPLGMEVDHKDDDRMNCKSDNLQYLTPKQNSIKAGLKRRGQPSGRVILTKDQVLEIRKIHGTPEFSRRVLAERFGVSRTCIDLVVTRKSWKLI